MPIRAVLFDAAETLFTTRGSVGELYSSVARDYGSTASAETIQSAFVYHFRQSGPVSTDDEKAWWKDIVHRVFTDVGMVRDFDQFFDRVYDKFRDSRGWMLFPETASVLQAVRDRGLKLGVISNFDSRVYSVMRSLDIFDYFHTITISSETGFAKPDPRIFQAAARALDIPPDEILLVGDSLYDDVEGAIRAGMEAVLIDRGNRYSIAGHVRRITSLEQVLSII